MKKLVWTGDLGTLMEEASKVTSSTSKKRKFLEP
jgi:hypothetical protein